MLNTKLLTWIFFSDNNKNPRSDGGYTPLHIAASNGHLEICQIILEEVDDKNPVTDNGLTPLYLAANNGHLEVFKFIFKIVTAKNPQHCPVTNTVECITRMMWTLLKMFWKWLEEFTIVKGLHAN